MVGDVLHFSPIQFPGDPSISRHEDRSDELLATAGNERECSTRRESEPRPDLRFTNPDYPEESEANRACVPIFQSYEPPISA